MRTLLHFLAQEIDQRLAVHREGTSYGEVRPSDVRVFAYAALGAASLSDIARVLGISRQAVHMSAQRLQELDLIELKTQEQDKRERAVMLTEKGKRAAATGQSLIGNIESEFAEIIGRDGVETLRQTLQLLIEHAKTKNRSAALITPLA